MRRLFDLTEEELLDLEADWWEREDEQSSSWINEGVQIYRQLSRMNQREATYKETLAYLLLKQGEEMKMRQHAYNDATTRFSQVVRMDPNNSRAYYRLGFLYFYQEEWTKSIDSFQQALETHPKQSRNKLDKEQLVKANHYILKSTQIILMERVGKIEKIPVEDLELFGEVKHLLKEVKEGFITSEEEKPYQMIVNGKEFRDISERDYVCLSDPFENEECVIFNQRSMNDTSISLHGREVTIPESQVSLLEYLMRHPEGTTREDIIQRRYRQSRDPESALRQGVSRLRSKLRELDPLNEFIQTIDGGYKWSWEIEYRIFKHSRNVTTEMLLD